MENMNDADCLKFIEPRDLWVLDKFILAKFYEYVCGPAGVPPPEEGEYIIRPCVNFKMMSAGAYVDTLSPEKYDIPDGFFWCEKFQGRHLSFDYNYGKQVLAVEGIRAGKFANRLDRFSYWQKVDETYQLSYNLNEIAKRYEWFNVEVIGNKVIEVHFRYNDDFRNHNSNMVIPIWKDEFYESRCGDRVGFLLV
jgi:hypothetical protein